MNESLIDAMARELGDGGRTRFDYYMCMRAGISWAFLAVAQHPEWAAAVARDALSTFEQSGYGTDIVHDVDEFVRSHPITAEVPA